MTCVMRGANEKHQRNQITLQPYGRYVAVVKRKYLNILDIMPYRAVSSRIRKAQK